MKRRLVLKEVPLWILIAIPIIYLYKNWDIVPETVPLHFNIFGEADRFGPKSALVNLAIIVSLLSYSIFLLARYFDPNKALSKMASKFYQLRLIFTIIVSAVLYSLFYSIINDSSDFSNSIFIIAAIIFIVLGNFFRNIKANYFIGIRTPWTLKNEEVWKETHRYSSILWVIGGLLMLLTNVLNTPDVAWLINVLILACLILIPFIYSYKKYKAINKQV